MPPDFIRRSSTCHLKDQIDHPQLTVKIITYPHSTLRYRSKPIVRINQRLRDVVREMFRLMYEAKGVGLAANQVDLPLRLFVVNLAGKPGEGEELVYINPELSRLKGNDEQEEGCLSLPGIYAPVRRSERVTVSAVDLQGNPIDEELTGMHARVVQHEFDHLEGILFIDRVSDTAALTLRDEVADLEDQFQQALVAGAVRGEAEIARRRQEWESDYCESAPIP